MADVGDIEKKRICYGCVGETYLSVKISKEGKRAVCDYCEKNRRAISIATMSELVDVAFQQHYRRSRMEMDGYEWAMHKDPESTFEFEPEGDPIDMAIMNAAEISEEAAADIQELLEDRYSSFESAQIGETTEYDGSLYYHEILPSDRAWQEDWHAFERSLKSESRFFSPQAADLLTKVFSGISNLQTQTGASLITEAGPETELTHLFRARAFQSPGKLKTAIGRPDNELGPPSSPFAGSGRMNARGISVFYGATEPGVAVAEVRPPVGCHVAIGRFEVIRKLRLLDLGTFEKLAATGSIFDPSYSGELSRIRFLRGLTLRIARPVMPDDQELDYLPTQAVADFLAAGLVAPLDGIIFPSVQVAGESRNVVLFHNASRVEKWDVPEDLEIDVSIDSSDEDGSYPDFASFWWRKANDEQSAVATDEADSGFWIEFEQALEKLTPPGGEATLRISPHDVEVRLIEAVEFKSSDYKVRHHEMKVPTDADL
ncbi:RES family NAD+ phosphorylase [Rhizobium lentis]|uniref:RES family NAD+ phosphorylase n=1 Tax=Rhizobium lentis TaxID=1138194 RepID=UPI001C835296|nr:RES family NAD+ phosphorylase [Rhizobium lentis]MBX5131265.1 RES family NAD+ phosphorylase [Rhizobium lentis]